MAVLVSVKEKVLLLVNWLTNFCTLKIHRHSTSPMQTYGVLSEVLILDVLYHKQAVAVVKRSIMTNLFSASVAYIVRYISER